MGARHWLLRLETVWEGARRRRARSRPPAHFRIEAYVGHGGAEGVVVRGRVLDDPPPSEAVEGEGVGSALLRTVRHFLTDDLPDVPLRIIVGDAAVETVTDDDGYFQVRLGPGADGLDSPWTSGTVELAGPYRGIAAPPPTPLEVLVPGPGAAFGVISDIDDTILETGVQRLAHMARQTLTGSALT